MRIRKAETRDIPPAVELARTLDLDYPGMESDALWVAEGEERIVGVVSLKEHPGCLELCALGVDPRCREKGIGRALVEALMDEAPGDVHLGTVIPGFFLKCGFSRAPETPVAFMEKRKTSWCEGCRTEDCTVMVRRAS